MKFFSFWRSLASFRVRIALNLKNLPAEVIFVDIDANAHRGPEYKRVNPQMALPALVEDDGTTLFQSLAILEYLDEKYPSPPLLPATDALGLAHMTDGTIVVARYKSTRREQLARAIESLVAVRARILGIVLDRVPAPAASASYYGYRAAPAGVATEPQGTRPQHRGDRRERPAAPADARSEAAPPVSEDAPSEPSTPR